MIEGGTQHRLRQREEDPMPSRQNGAYVSRIIHSEPASAGRVLDALYRGLAPVGVTQRFVRLSDRLWLSADGLEAEPGPQVVRSVHGILWYGCYPVRVMVELVEWSTIACEAAIRPLSYSWPVWTDRYARYAADHLDRIVSSLDPVDGSGVEPARAKTAGGPFVLVNGWNTAASFGCRTQGRQWSDAATPAVGPLA
jgi:hypothetical protein